MTAELANLSALSFLLTPAWPSTEMKVGPMIGSATFAGIQATVTLESQSGFSPAHSLSHTGCMLVCSLATSANSVFN